LFWQQWRLPSRALERVANAVRSQAAAVLHKPANVLRPSQKL
jgi:hypothetical protein